MTDGERDVHFVCNFNPTGVGRHSENAFYGVLRQRREGIVPYYVDNLKDLSLRSWAADERNRRATSLFFWRVPLDVLPNMPGRKIGWLFFESDRLPPTWIDQMRGFDQLWMPSDWGRRVLLAHGIPEESIRVVPAGVDPSYYHPAPVAHENFVFLTVGKYEKRKSIDEAIEAFVAEFPAADYPDVEFRIKADHPVFPERVAQLSAHHAADPRLKFVSGLFSDHELAQLYGGADAFVFPTKAEGFGLPCLEALACGLPVITTLCSAQQVFLDTVEGLYLRVDGEEVEIDDPDYAYFYAREYGTTPFGRWFRPNMESLRAAMRAAYRDRALWRERAATASERVRAQFSWDAIGRRAVDTLLADFHHGVGAT